MADFLAAFSWRLALAAIVSAIALPSAVRAADLPASHLSAVRAGNLALTCDDGRTYRLQPRAISDDGDLVTGYLLNGPGGQRHLRLVPMGDGYRYAGIGVWLDGIRADATLNFGFHRSTHCQVAAL
jgi:hypothetical protein